jgi:hypothetical protein
MPEATEAILKHATEMGMRYSSKIPIVEAADQRIKIARLAVSCAACMFSTEDGENVVVKKEHVDYVVDFLHNVFSSKSLGYDKLSEQDKVNSDASDGNIASLRQQFLLIPLSDFNQMARILFQLPYFSRNTLEDYTGLQRDDLRILLKFLTTEHLVEKVKGDYRRYPLGTKFLEDLISNPVTKEEIDAARKDFYSNSEY